MITKSFPTQPRNFALLMNNDTNSASNINVEQNLMTNQVAEVPDSSSKNLGDEHVVTNNPSEEKTL